MATYANAPAVVHVAAPAVPPPPVDHPASKYKHVFKGLGIVLIIAGVLSFVLGAVGLSPTVTGTGVYIGSGLWGGAWYIASGALSIATATHANSCNVIAGMVVSILTSIIAFCVGVSEAVIAGVCSINYDIYYPYGYYGCPPSYKGIHGTIACLAFLSCVLAIVHSSFCCCGGCGQANHQGTVLTTTVTTVPLQQTYVTGQPMAPAYYPQIVQGQQPMMQGQQYAAYPPVQNQLAFAPAPAGSSGAPPQAQNFAPPPYAHPAEPQKQALQ